MKPTPWLSNENIAAATDNMRVGDVRRVLAKCDQQQATTSTLPPAADCDDEPYWLTCEECVVYSDGKAWRYLLNGVDIAER